MAEKLCPYCGKLSEEVKGYSVLGLMDCMGCGRDFTSHTGSGLIYRVMHNLRKAKEEVEVELEGYKEGLSEEAIRTLKEEKGLERDFYDEVGIEKRVGEVQLMFGKKFSVIEMEDMIYCIKGILKSGT